MVIPFTDQEMQNAWRQNRAASNHTSRTNAHRLLLFYAVECGLKAILMRRQGIKRTDLCPTIAEAQHNINKLLDSLGAGGALSLPKEIVMKQIKDTRNNKKDRKLNPGQINQMWRYGGCCIKDPKDQDVEKKLLEIVKWIEGELDRL
ncbi:MAG TPA: hypothetical protein DCL61_26890 [Cyanobacteria bacterium UBA12227]|nr:hypothetical protein [Cyanobacteria bacterium UBA12227]HAX85598.1 hypothetical protein [Cyanobacteria bacterium UBA11370]HBY77911.1 hypothetical protein [Cyanobacteria bacterium UBA11148]